MSDKPSFRGALYGNSVQCSFGNLDQFLDDLIALRTAVAELFEALGASQEDVECLAEEKQRIRTLFELPAEMDLVEGIIKRLRDWEIEQRDRDIKIENLSRALLAFAMAGEGPMAQCDPNDIFFDEKDEDGVEVVICYRDFQEAAKTLERHGARK